MLNTSKGINRVGWKWKGVERLWVSCGSCSSVRDDPGEEGRRELEGPRGQGYIDKNETRSLGTWERGLYMVVGG